MAEEGKDQLKPASQPNSLSVPDDQFLSSLGIGAPSPTANVATTTIPPVEKPVQTTEAQPDKATPQEPSAPPPVRKYLDKFENPDELEKYAQEMERTKSTFETENKMLRKQWDKFLDQMQSQPNVPVQTASPTGNQATPEQVNQYQKATTGFKPTPEEIREIMEVDAVGGFEKLFARYDQYIEQERAPKIVQKFQQQQMAEMAEQQRAKEVHDTFYTTYGDRIKSELREGMTISNAKMFVKQAWDLVYGSLPRYKQQQIDQNPILLFPQVADEAVKNIRLWTGSNGNTPAPAKTTPAPVLSGGGSRPSPQPNPLEPKVITTPEGYKAQMDDPKLVEWFITNKR